MNNPLAMTHRSRCHLVLCPCVLLLPMLLMTYNDYHPAQMAMMARRRHDDDSVDATTARYIASPLFRKHPVKMAVTSDSESPQCQYAAAFSLAYRGA